MIEERERERKEEEREEGGNKRLFLLQINNEEIEIAFHLLYLSNSSVSDSANKLLSFTFWFASLNSIRRFSRSFFMGKEYSADLQETKNREMLRESDILLMPMDLEKVIYHTWLISITMIFFIMYKYKMSYL